MFFKSLDMKNELRALVVFNIFYEVDNFHYGALGELTKHRTRTVNRIGDKGMT